MLLKVSNSQHHMIYHNYHIYLFVLKIVIFTYFKRNLMSFTLLKDRRIRNFDEIVNLLLVSPGRLVNSFILERPLACVLPQI